MDHLQTVIYGAFEIENGKAIRDGKWALGRIREGRREVDLFVWLESSREPRYRGWSWSVDRFDEVRKRTGVDVASCLGVDLATPDHVFKAIE